MWNDRLKEEYLAMEVPELREKILEKAKREKTVRTQRKLRPAAMAAVVLMIAVLAVTAGAVTNGIIRLQYGSYYRFVDDAGNIVKPTGFHMEDGVDVPLSETALDNIMPYVYLYDEDETCFHTSDPAGMEAFIGRAMHLPECFAETAAGYCLRAYGTPEYAATIYVEIVPEDAQDDVSLKMYLRSGPINILTESTPKLYAYALPDGTPVSIAVADSLQDGKVGFAFYRYADAVYQLRVQGTTVSAIRSRIEQILDTVG